MANPKLRCSHCTGEKAPDGLDAKDLDPLIFCNPDYCDLHRYHGKFVGGIEEQGETDECQT